MERVTCALILCTLAFFTTAQTVSQESGLQIETSPLDLETSDLPIVVRGYAVDEAGAPVGGASIHWWEYERPEGLRGLDQEPAARTGPDGHFEVLLPGMRVQYVLHVAAVGFEPLQRSHFGPPQPIHARLTPRRADAREPVLIQGSVSGDGQPAPATIHFRAREQGDDQDHQAGPLGAFEFTTTRGAAEQIMVYAASDGRVSRYHGVGDLPKVLSLELGAPGQLQGQVLAREGDTPVAGCSVRLVTTYARVVFQTLETDAEGRFTAIDLPPGPYHVMIEHPRFADPLSLSRTQSPPQIMVKAGETARYQATLAEMTEVSGVVNGADGLPVAGAWVGFEASISSRSNGYDPPERVAELLAPATRTDSDGRFTLYTPYSDQSGTLEAYHPAGGLGQAIVQIPGPGGRNPNARVALSGAFRLRGAVTDETGAPIPKVQIGALETDESGCFDSGFAALPAKTPDELTLDFVAPRPAPDGPATQEFDAQRTFYLHRTVRIQPAAGQQLNMAVTLTPTRTLELYGTLTGPDGMPVPRARVRLVPWNTRGPGWIPREGRSGSLFSRPYLKGGPTPLATVGYTTRADNTGAWRMLFPVETPASLRTSHRPANDQPTPNRALAYALRPTGMTATVRADLPEAGFEQTVYLDNLATLPDRVEVPVEFSEPKARPESFIRARVTDSNGNPLEDIAWSLTRNGVTETLRTGTDGLLVFDRQERGNPIRLVSEDWSILSPEPHGEQLLEFRFIEGPQPHPIVLAKRGGMELHVHYPDGTPVDVGVLRDGEWVRIEHRDGPGTAQVPGLNPGTQTITLATRAGYRADHTVEVPAGGSGVAEIEIPEPACELDGRLVGPAGETYAALSVSMVGDSYERHLRSDNEGRFVLRAPPGTYVLGATRNGIPCLADAFQKTVTLTEDQPRIALDLAVTPAPPGEDTTNLGRPIRFTVHLAATDPGAASGILLTAEKQSESNVHWSGVTDRTGFHTFENMLPGVYHVRFAPGGLLGEQRTYQIPAEPESARIHRIPLDEGVTVTGQLHGTHFQHETSVWLNCPVAGLSISIAPDDSGRFTVSSVPPGPATLHVRTTKPARRARVALIVAPAMAPVEVDLTAPADAE